jgi:hypothetical protein
MRGHGWRFKRGQRGILPQRAWGIVLVLCLILAMAYGIAKNAHNKKVRDGSAFLSCFIFSCDIEDAKGLAPAVNATRTAAAAQARATEKAVTGNTVVDANAGARTAPSPDRFGLSFGHGTLPGPSTSLMYSACAGTPLEMGNPDKSQCNPYQGDTSCRTALPVLCALKDGGTAESAGLVNEPKADGGATGFNFYAGWIGGTLAATAPVAGFVIGSLAQANARCASELGTGWRMAEFHDAGGGWGLVGKRGQGLVNTNTRHWVAINDQKSNCWDPS